MEDPKPRRQRDEDYKEWVTRFPCVVTGRPAHDPNHLDHKGGGGSDLTCVPMTRKIHTIFHKTPLRKFERQYGINLWRAAHQLTRRYFRGRHNHNDENYLYWVDKKNCVVDPREESDLFTRLTGPRGNDYTAVPMTEETYDLFSSVRFRSFEAQYNINLWRESHKLLRGYFTDDINPIK